MLDAKIIACQYLQSIFEEAVKCTIQDITLERTESCYYEKLPELGEYSSRQAQAANPGYIFRNKIDKPS